MTSRPPVLPRPARPGNAFEETVARLLEIIRLGMLAPGEALAPERELAARLQVSRETVREAIRSLTAAGYLVTRRGRYGGTFLAHPQPVPVPAREPVTRRTIDDVIAMREILETGAARCAAHRDLGAADRDGLLARLAAVDGAAPGSYRRLDSRLHVAIAEAAGVPSLVAPVIQNRMQVNELLDRIPLLDRNIAHSDGQHRELVGAILAGDAERAATVTAAHIAGSAALLHAFLD